MTSQHPNSTFTSATASKNKNSTSSKSRSKPPPIELDIQITKKAILPNTTGNSTSQIGSNRSAGKANKASQPQRSGPAALLISSEGTSITNAPDLTVNGSLMMKH